jgi:hypothetical protein
MVSFRLCSSTDPIFPLCPETGMDELQRLSLLNGVVVERQS